MSLDIEKISNSIDNLSPFEKDKTFFFCYKKLNKLLKAIIILTKDNKDEFLIKDTVGAAISIVDNNIKFFIGGSEFYRNLVIEKMLMIFSQIEALSINDFISTNNAQILISEYGSVANIVSKADVLSHKNSREKELKNEYFNEVSLGNLESKIKESLERNERPIESIKDSIKDINLSYKHDFNNEFRKISLNKSYANKKDKNQKTSESSNSRVVSKLKNQNKEKDTSERTKSILNIIRDNKSVTIKDVSNIVSDISEKTIQRELSSLVISGVLRREGERRWSRYSLA